MMDTIYSILGAILPLEAYQYSFMKNAFLAILLLTPLLGLLGTMAVNHQMAFFSDALGHSALTGIGLGIILGLRNDLVAMLVFGIIWAILICVIKQSGSASTDTVISVFSSTSVAAGLLILARGGKFAKYSSLLIGDVLAVTPSDLLWLLLALIGTLILWALLYNSLLLTSVDSVLARSRGIKTRLVECAFVVMVAIAVMLSIRWVGVMLINALLPLQRPPRPDPFLLSGHQCRRVHRTGFRPVLCRFPGCQGHPEIKHINNCPVRRPVRSPFFC